MWVEAYCGNTCNRSDCTWLGEKLDLLGLAESFVCLRASHSCRSRFDSRADMGWVPYSCSSAIWPLLCDLYLPRGRGC